MKSPTITSEATTTIAMTMIVAFSSGRRGTAVGVKVGKPVGRGVRRSLGLEGPTVVTVGDEVGVDGFDDGATEYVGVAVGIELGCDVVVGEGVSENNSDTMSVVITGIPRSFRSLVTRPRSALMKIAKLAG